MKTILYRLLILIFLIIIGFITYLNTIGIKTDSFNNQISTEIKKINNHLDLDLDEISISLDLLKFELNLKTIGAILKNKDKEIKIESIRTNIDIKTIFNKQFSLSEVNISTRSIEIKKLISFIRQIENIPQLFILEKFIKKGYLIADINLKFDKKGNINENYNIKGLVRDGEIKSINEFNLSKINFLFDLKNNIFSLNDLKISIDKNVLLFPELNIKKDNDGFFISGKNKSKNITLVEDQLNKFFDNNLPVAKINSADFDLNSSFSFLINSKFKIKNQIIKSELNLKKMDLSSKLNLNKYLPESNNIISLKNHKLQIEYKKNYFNIKGIGEAHIQKEKDNIEYNITKSKKDIKFKTLIKIKKNPFYLDFINYKKDANSILNLSFDGNKDFKSGQISFNKVLLKEENNIIEIRNLQISKNNKIQSIDKIDLDYIDVNFLKNKMNISKQKRNYDFNSTSINLTKMLDDMLKPGKNFQIEKIFENNFKLNIKSKKTFLDKKNIINDLEGYLVFENNEIIDAKLDSFFSKDKKLKLTIRSTPNEIITTLYSDVAKPFIDRYEFIKGFEGGNLDFYSIKNDNSSTSKLIIDNFKVQEVPALAKLLTLASLQGIADLLTGEGIRFSDFEMKYSNTNGKMKIEELYAIGPAISILMDGYVERNKLVSLRGTMVPATTINRTISSIPLIGSILVGEKVGEGVFGVSFKIKGPPKKLKTTVNPVKTLTPRFITRTLEKLKKN